MSEESLNAQFAALHAEREKSWDAELLRKNVEQRRRLEERYRPENHVRAGDVVEPFELLNAEGGVIGRDELVRRGPAVLIFFRFAGCPACNIALPYYDRQLWPHLAAAGIPLVAVSPQVPERLIEIKQRHGLRFPVATDTDNRLADRLGISFEPDEKPQVAPGESWIGSITGTNGWALPQPTVLILGRDARVLFVEVSPDWLRRTEAPAILSALRE